MQRISVTSPQALRASGTREPRPHERAPPTSRAQERRSFEPPAQRGRAHDPRAEADRLRSTGAPRQHPSVAAASAAAGRVHRARVPVRRPMPPPGAPRAPPHAVAASRRRGRNRSSRARESFSRYAESRCGEHAHSTAGSPRPPHGHMFIVPTSWNRAGKIACPPTRATATNPSSSGWRSDSRTERGNSGSSSMNSTPRCARETSPGRGLGPPPTIAGADAP